MSKPTQAQKDAFEQLKAAFAACEAAGLRVLAQGSDSAYEVGVSDFDTVDDVPVGVLWMGDDYCVELDCCDEEVTVEAVEEICEQWLTKLGNDKDNAWPNVLSQLDVAYCSGTDAYDTAVVLASNYFQAS